MMNRRVLTLLCITVLMLCGMGCSATGTPPKGWSVATSPDSWQPEPERDHEPRLQIIFSFNSNRATHTAVRVTGPQHIPVFWDPGGNYGYWNEKYGRTRDVVIDEPPTTARWWWFRSFKLNEKMLQVYEWDIEVEQATSMQEYILKGAQRSGDRPWMRTDAIPGLCNMAVIGFLTKRAQPKMSLGFPSTWPGDLAKKLWRKNPDRVLRYTSDPDLNQPPEVLVYTEPN